eukprot:2757950-Heterocapsa_arctica.AAC.1
MAAIAMDKGTGKGKVGKDKGAQPQGDEAGKGTGVWAQPQGKGAQPQGKGAQPQGDEAGKGNKGK